MRKIEFQQGSPEWLGWRKTLITATDAPVLMGASPYSTPYKAWQRKLGLAPEQTVTAPMRRGTHDEPIARDLFNQEFKMDMVPCCIESDQYNFLGASLDGISSCGKYLIEIKSQVPYSGPPDHHMMQMQHQMLCTDSRAEMCFYVSYWDGEIDVQEVFPNPNWVEAYLEKAKEFWKGIVFFEPPALTQKDYKDMNASNIFTSSAAHYRDISEQIKRLEDQKDSIKKELVSLCDDENCAGGGIKILKKTVKGRVDYDAIPEIKNLNLDIYRKPSSSSWTIMLDAK